MKGDRVTQQVSGSNQLLIDVPAGGYSATAFYRAEKARLELRIQAIYFEL